MAYIFCLLLISLMMSASTGTHRRDGVCHVTTQSFQFVWRSEPYRCDDCDDAWGHHHHRFRRSSWWSSSESEEPCEEKTCYRRMLVLERKVEDHQVCCDGYIANARGRCIRDMHCGNRNGGCQHICSRDQSTSRLTCSCHRGYRLVRTTQCQDINECAEANGGCSQRCNNLEPDFYCSCRKGFILTNRTFCEAIKPSTSLTTTSLSRDTTTTPTTTTTTTTRPTEFREPLGPDSGQAGQPVPGDAPRRQTAADQLNDGGKKRHSTTFMLAIIVPLISLVLMLAALALFLLLRRRRSTESAASAEHPENVYEEPLGATAAAGAVVVTAGVKKDPGSYDNQIYSTSWPTAATPADYLALIYDSTVVGGADSAYPTEPPPRYNAKIHA